MRFRFLGGADAPDWMLAEMAILAKMSSVRMKLICRQILNDLTGVGLSMEKIEQLTSSARIQLSYNDQQALIATLHLIFSSAAKHSVEPSVLSAEIEQLGLPKDVCNAIVKEYNNAMDAVREWLKTQIVSYPRVTRADWRVDHIMSSSSVGLIDQPITKLDLVLSKADLKSGNKLSVHLDQNQLKMLLHELRGARELMAQLQS